MLKRFFLSLTLVSIVIDFCYSQTAGTLNWTYQLEQYGSQTCSVLPNGNIVFIDGCGEYWGDQNSFGKVKCINPNGELLWTWSKDNIYPDQFNSTVISSSGKIYFVADSVWQVNESSYSSQKYIFVLNREGDFYKSFTGMAGISNLSLDGEDNLYFTTYTPKAVWKYDSEIQLIWSKSIDVIEGGLSRPTISADGTVYVGHNYSQNNQYKGKLVSISNQGEINWEIELGGYLRSQTAIIDMEGNVIVLVNPMNFDILLKKYSNDGVLLWSDIKYDMDSKTPVIDNHNNTYRTAQGSGSSPSFELTKYYKNGNKLLDKYFSSLGQAGMLILNNGDLIVKSSGSPGGNHIECFDENGNKKWEYQPPYFMYYPPILDKIGNIIIVARDLGLGKDVIISVSSGQEGLDYSTWPCINANSRNTNSVLNNPPDLLETFIFARNQNHITLDWSMNDLDTNSKIIIFKSNINSFTTSMDNSIGIFDASDGYYQDYDIAPDSTYYYKCRVLKNNLLSLPTSAQSLMNAPTNLSATAGNGYVTLSWSPNNEGELSGYRIYGGTSSNPTTLVAMVASPDTSFNHEGLSNGTTYYYRITAINSYGSESDYSNEVWTTPSNPGPTNISGNYFSNYCWSKTGSPYNITGDVGIAEGAILKIEPGVEILGNQENREILINGTLLATGNVHDSIIFYGVTTIKFYNSNLSDSKIEYVQINHVTVSTSSGCSGILELINIRANNSTINQGTQIIKTINSFLKKTSVSVSRGGECSIINSILENCQTRLEYASSGAALNIQGCLFKKGMIYSNRDCWSQYLKVSNCTLIESSVYNGGVNGEFTNCIFINSPIQGTCGGNLKLINSIVKFNSNFGINCNTGDYAHNCEISSSQIIGDNTETGINITNGSIYSSVICNLNKGIVVAPNPYVGSSGVMITNSNFVNISSNLIENTTNSSLTAINNYWGINDSVQISQRIYDYYDNLNYGKVDFSPWLTSFSESAPLPILATVIKKLTNNVVKLDWLPSISSRVSGYKIYYSNPTGYSYENCIDAGNVNSYVLPSGISLSDEIAVTAYDDESDGVNDQIEGHESWFAVAKEYKNITPVKFTQVDSTEKCHYFVLESASIDGSPLQTGDEVGIFDGDVCVGAGGFNGTFPMIITCYGAEGGAPGFTAGDSIIVKLYDASQLRYATVTAVNYTFGNGHFVEGGFAKASLQGSVYQSVSIPLTANRFNLISSYLFPRYPNAGTLFSTVPGLKIAYEDNGAAYIPKYSINTIGDLDITEGYHLFVAETDRVLTISGLTIDPANFPLNLAANRFNSVGYLQSAALDVTAVFGEIADNIAIIQDDDGGVWIPSMGINSLGNLQPLDGYQIFITGSEPIEFTYPDLTGGLAKKAKLAKSEEVQPKQFQFQKTGLPYTIIISSAVMDGQELTDGDEIGVFWNEQCVGAAVYQRDEALVLSAWKGDDKLNIPGYRAGDEIQFRAYSQRFKKEFELNAQFGRSEQGYFEGAAYAVANLQGQPGLIPERYALHQNYPNPFNSQTVIPYDVPNEAELSLIVYDILGREVVRLIERQPHQPGRYRCEWNGLDRNGIALSSGIYFIRMITPEFQKVQKMVMMK